MCILTENQIEHLDWFTVWANIQYTSRTHRNVQQDFLRTCVTATETTKILAPLPIYQMFPAEINADESLKPRIESVSRHNASHCTELNWVSFYRMTLVKNQACLFDVGDAYQHDGLPNDIHRSHTIRAIFADDVTGTRAARQTAAGARQHCSCDAISCFASSRGYSGRPIK